MSRRILIEGDSWAYIWHLLPDGSAEPRPGFYSMWQEPFCHCSATAGHSNGRMLAHLQTYRDPWDLCILVVTEPIREWLTVKHTISGITGMGLDLAPIADRIRAAGSLEMAMRQSLRSFFQSLNDLGRPVWLLGGCCHVPIELLEGLDNLSCPIPSISTLLIPDIKDSIYQDTHQWSSREYADWVMAQGDIALIREWYRITGLIRDKIDHWYRDTRYFYPDNWHPNEQAHALIARELKPKLDDFPS